MARYILDQGLGDSGHHFISADKKQNKTKQNNNSILPRVFNLFLFCMSEAGVHRQAIGCLQILNLGKLISVEDILIQKRGKNAQHIVSHFF